MPQAESRPAKPRRSEQPAEVSACGFRWPLA